MPLHTIGDYPPSSTRASFAILERVVSLFEAWEDAYRVVGGWCPYLLCREHSSLGQHVGSNDIDILLRPGAFGGSGPDPLARALEGAGFRPEESTILRGRPNRNAGTWWAPGPKEHGEIRIDFLAPADSPGEDKAETIIGDLKVLRFYGTSAALSIPDTVRWSGTRWSLEGREGRAVTLASGAAALMAKAIAYASRREDEARGKASKDAYDLYYLVTAYERGTDALVNEMVETSEVALRDRALEILETVFPEGSGNVGGFDISHFLGEQMGDEVIFDSGLQISGFVRAVRERIS